MLIKLSVLKKQISCSFVPKSNGNVGFNVDSYDKSKPLIIDPLLYSTFMAVGDIDEGNDVMLDYENNVIVVGRPNPSICLLM